MIVKELFKGENIHYVDCNKGNEGYLDIKLMSLAKVNIIANSTFMTKKDMITGITRKDGRNSILRMNKTNNTNK